jgi:hypothetical protein
MKIKFRRKKFLINNDEKKIFRAFSFYVGKKISIFIT